MKPMGLKYRDPGCCCSLCLSRGYRKDKGWESFTVARKSTERQLAKQIVSKEIENA